MEEFTQFLPVPIAKETQRQKAQPAKKKTTRQKRPAADRGAHKRKAKKTAYERMKNQHEVPDDREGEGYNGFQEGLYNTLFCSCIRHIF